MISRTCSRIRASLILALCAIVLVQETHAFVRGNIHVNTQPILFTSRTQLAATKKKAGKKAEGSKKAEVAKKAPAAKKKAAEKADVEIMRKSEVIASVAGKLQCTKSDAEAALAAVLGTITENVVAGKKVNIAGFGSFQLRARAARKGRNPQTGEEIDIKASNSPGFTAAKAFKDLANE
mmetsp:Transcript_74460/g.215226  ORF Transcript_74460/g.215226 Transcript_74460/m.215226 type:complete len:179 (-) Transcript_74460:99-635(-)